MIRGQHVSPNAPTKTTEGIASFVNFEYSPGTLPNPVQLADVAILSALNDPG